MKKLKLFGIFLALLFCGNAFAQNVYYVECSRCDPSNTNDPEVISILRDYYNQTNIGDIVSIMEDWKDPVTGARPVTNYKRKPGSFQRIDSGSAVYAASPEGAGDGRTWVVVSEVLVMYPTNPTASTTVEGIIESGSYGGCNAKTNPGNTCAAPSSVNPGGGNDM
jgi:hypothetical protein